MLSVQIFLQNGSKSQNALTRSGEKPHACDQCKYSSTLAQALKRHKPTLSGERHCHSEENCLVRPSKENMSVPSSWFWELLVWSVVIWGRSGVILECRITVCYDTWSILCITNMRSSGLARGAGRRMPGHSSSCSRTHLTSHILGRPGGEAKGPRCWAINQLVAFQTYQLSPQRIVVNGAQSSI